MVGQDQKYTLEKEVGRAPVRCSCRWLMACMHCFGTLLATCLCNNMSMIIVCIFPNGRETSGWSDSSNGTLASEKTYESSAFNWTEEVIGLLISAHFYGYLISSLLGGYIVSWLRPKRTFLLVGFVAVLTTMTSPSALYISPYLVIFMRIVLGIFLGMVGPAIQGTITPWSPRHESGTMITLSTAGGNFASIVSYGLSGVICTLPFGGGWPLVFYVFGGKLAMAMSGSTGILTFCWMMLIQFFVYNSPEEHPRISPCEKKYISNQRKNTSPSDSKPRTPGFKEVFLSGPIWAIMLGGLANGWTFSISMTTMPIYMRDVLLFDTVQIGLMSSFPGLCRAIASMFVAPFADWLISKKRIRPIHVRRGLYTGGALLPAISLVALSFVDQTQPALGVVLLIIPQMLGCGMWVALITNIADIAPARFGVTLFSVLYGGIFGLSGIIGPFLTTILTADGSREEWQVVYIVCACMLVFGNVSFTILAGKEELPWVKTDSETEHLLVDNRPE